MMFQSKLNAIAHAMGSVLNNCIIGFIENIQVMWLLSWHIFLKDMNAIILKMKELRMNE